MLSSPVSVLSQPNDTLDHPELDNAWSDSDAFITKLSRLIDVENEENCAPQIKDSFNTIRSALTQYLLTGHASQLNEASDEAFKVHETLHWQGSMRFTEVKEQISAELKEIESIPHERSHQVAVDEGLTRFPLCENTIADTTDRKKLVKCIGYHLQDELKTRIASLNSNEAAKNAAENIIEQWLQTQIEYSQCLPREIVNLKRDDFLRLGRIISEDTRLAAYKDVVLDGFENAVSSFLTNTSSAYFMSRKQLAKVALYLPDGTEHRLTPNERKDNKAVFKHSQLLHEKFAEFPVVLIANGGAGVAGLMGHLAKAYNSDPNREPLAVAWLSNDSDVNLQLAQTANPPDLIVTYKPEYERALPGITPMFNDHFAVLCPTDGPFTLEQTDESELGGIDMLEQIIRRSINEFPGTLTYASRYDESAMGAKDKQLWQLASLRLANDTAFCDQHEFSQEKDQLARAKAILSRFETDHIYKPDPDNTPLGWDPAQVVRYAKEQQLFCLSDKGILSLLPLDNQLEMALCASDQERDILLNPASLSHREGLCPNGPQMTFYRFLTSADGAAAIASFQGRNASIGLPSPGFTPTYNG